MSLRHTIGSAALLSLVGMAQAYADDLPPPRLAQSIATPGRGLPELAQSSGERSMRGPETAGLPVAVPLPETLEPPPRPSTCWATADYLYWWLSGAPVAVPLLTTRTPVNGDVGRQTLIGTNLGRFDPFNGVRLEAGVWLDDDHAWAVWGSGFLVETRSSRLSFNGIAGQQLDRPLVNALTGGPFIVPVSVPDLLQGGVVATARIEFGGAEAGASVEVLRGPTCRIDLLGGYRFLNLHESLSVVQQSEVAPLVTVDTVAFGTLIGQGAVLATDQLETTNRFHGAEIGARASWQWRTVDLTLMGKAAVGVAQEEIRNVGSTVVTPGVIAGVPALAPVSAPGGLLVQPTNTGLFTRDRLAFASEIGITAGVQVMPRVRLTAGCSVLYWEGVVRPGNQIDGTINPAQLALSAAFQPGPLQGPARPVVPFRLSDFWAQGFILGMEVSF